MVVISAALVVFYFVTGIKLLLRLKVSKKYGRKIRNLKEVSKPSTILLSETNWIEQFEAADVDEFCTDLFRQTTVKILSSIGFLFVIVCIFVLFLTDVAYTPLGKSNS